jgi:ankyrin repeat protein
VGALLLDRGAQAQPSTPKPVHGASPLFYAVWTGNMGTVARLRAQGAPLNAKTQLAGILPISPMEMAVFLHNVGVVRGLAKAGADVNEVDETGVSLLTGAVLGNDVPMARALISLGAKVDLVDEHGMTALMHAASVDFGDTAMVELLLGSGSSQGLKTKEGLMAVDLARKYGHTAMVRALSQSRSAN